ncbi:S-adenosylmethionine decarboxylase uORF [Gossypium australe]|uniref:S-adenosylmethionine decarboxylase uORF n=1 Tax=Gossypium australe TaxID=47621 RepID=A0A5B6VQX8_9ROSI|nr:S-adenosylmethionine decarboxylase uORF [Gossypium australe]
MNCLGLFKLWVFYTSVDLNLNWFYLKGSKGGVFYIERLNDLMETKGGKKTKSNSSSKSFFYEAPLGYSIEDVRPHGGIKKFRSAAYSNCVRKPS